MGPPPDDMGGMHSHMDDAAAHGPQDPGPGTIQWPVIWMVMV